MSSKRLGVFVIMFFAMFLLWFVPLVVAIVTYGGLTVRSRGVVKLNAQLTAPNVLGHAMLAIYTAMHLMQIKDK